MSDYIKRDDAIAVINNYIGDDSPYAQWFVRKIEQIDAVPVVRCKDCKHWMKMDGSCFPHADYNDFCSNGERKDDE